MRQQKRMDVAIGHESDAPVRSRAGAADAALPAAALLRVACLFPAAALLLWAPQALAFRSAGDLSRFDGTERVAWPWGEIRYEIHDDLPEDLDIDSVRQVVRNAVATWEGLECGGPTFIDKGLTSDPAEPGDGVNTVEWVASGWLERGFPENAAGFTDVGYVRLGGGQWEINEADLYLNGESYSWVLDGAPGEGERTVASVLTHEAGHMLGLMHPCEIGGGPEVPDCADVPEAAHTAMYPLYDPAQVQLSQDDIDGACFLYPAEGTSDAPGLAESPKSLGCSTDDDCRRGLQCEDGDCIYGTLRVGDQCSADTDCASRVCTDTGACAPSCEDDADCGPEGSCETIDNLGAACVTGDQRAFGAGCTSPDQCVSGYCVESTPGDNFCSRPCDPEIANDCPRFWSCESVDDEPVCLPSSQLATGGCAVMPDPDRSGSSGGFWALGMGLLDVYHAPAV